jgi:hypothetical protein
MDNNTDLKIDLKSMWRPAIAWLYIAICFFDFMIFPILWNVAQISFLKTIVITPWDPLTLKGGGLFHVSMGAILGVTAYGRTQEKINGVTTTSAIISSSSLAKPPTPNFPTRD